MATTTTSGTPRFTDEQLAELLSLISGSDSVELKLTVPESHHRSAIGGLGLDPLTAQIRQVFFFDTPELTLNQHGLVVRARRIQGKGADSVVKLRPVVPDELPKGLRTSDDFNVEVDAMPGGFVCSGALKWTLGTVDARTVAAGQDPIRKLFSKEQRKLFAERAPEGIALDDLHTLGPIFILKLRLTPDELGRRLVAELWLYPDGSRILELSTKCATNEAFQTAVELRSFLSGRGIDLSGEQETKTKKALEYFAGELRAQPDPVG